MSRPIDDLSLIAECRAGRSDAFGLLVQRYQDRLYPTALRLTGRSEDALDLLQETFLRGYRKLSGFHGESSFYTWVYRIMVNLALTERRRRRPRLHRPQIGAAAPDAADPSEDSSPDRRLERSESEDLVHRALDRLAADHRVVVVMKEFDGLRYDQIAEALGVPVGTVRSRLHRARVELRELLAPAVEHESSSSVVGNSVARTVKVGGDPSASSSVILPFRGSKPSGPLALTPHDSL